VGIQGGDCGAGYCALSTSGTALKTWAAGNIPDRERVDVSFHVRRCANSSVISAAAMKTTFPLGELAFDIEFQ
jgi:hypothetical protein